MLLFLEGQCLNRCCSFYRHLLTFFDNHCFCVLQSVGHHSHFLGTYQEIVVERDGVNLGPLRKEYHYDYNHQSPVQPVRALQQLLPGDRLAATCHFDTSSVDGEVQIGEESNKEMCFPCKLMIV